MLVHSDDSKMMRFTFIYVHVFLVLETYICTGFQVSSAGV